LKLKIAFLGDISLNGQYIDFYKKSVDPFINISPKLDDQNFVVGNLECMAQGERGENLLKRPRLTTTLETFNYLKKLNIKVVSLAHNHVYDHLEDGFVKTTTWLDENSILHLGASQLKGNESTPLILEGNGISIALLNYVTYDTNPNLPGKAQLYLNYFSKSKAASDIKKIRGEVDHIVMILHWGGRIEGGFFPDFDQPSIGRNLIDAGADLIIGHHSHTFQPYEVYNKKYIFYSLGNFCFSDYYFENEFTPLPRRRKLSGIVNVEFEKKYYHVNLSFFRSNGSSFSALPNFHYSQELRNFYFKQILKFKFPWYIYFLSQKHVLPIFHFLFRKDITFIIKVKRILISVKKRSSKK